MYNARDSVVSLCTVSCGLDNAVSALQCQCSFLIGNANNNDNSVDGNDNNNNINNNNTHSTRKGIIVPVVCLRLTEEFDQPPNPLSLP